MDKKLWCYALLIMFFHLKNLRGKENGTQTLWCSALLSIYIFFYITESKLLKAKEFAITMLWYISHVISASYKVHSPYFPCNVC